MKGGEKRLSKHGYWNLTTVQITHVISSRVPIFFFLERASHRYVFFSTLQEHNTMW